ncbi:MAG: polyhydroxyalkanoate synthesis repressor PhaR [Betaproteobacteria bacterium]|nr:MAG: polyhydroxyalkanoate synthesis repressor PhaR [Betaproteobacteria bacterium]
MSEPARLIKKYPNRRLYDTKTSVYITLADVKKLVMGGEEFQVVDAKTGEDLTRSILLQIILEEEAAGAPMFSSDVLTQFIRSYGNAMQGMLGAYLERNMQLFGEIQKSMQEQSQKLYGEPTKFNEELWKQFMSFQGPPASPSRDSLGCRDSTLRRAARSLPATRRRPARKKKPEIFHSKGLGEGVS